MKRSGFILLFAASFLGVLGALQLDRYLTHRNETKEPLFVMGQSGSTVIPTSMQGPGGTPAWDFRAAAKKVIPSVVSVDRYQRVGGNFFDPQERVTETGSGSGVIVSRDGLIVTNNHVVQGAEYVMVRLPDNRSIRAKVLGTDPRSDLAVLRITADNLTPVELGDNTQVQVGEWVLAVGNPLGYDNTVSVGVVSSLGRSLAPGGPRSISVLTDAIQTDAAINPGNSGGALTNAAGQLIGINSAIASNTGGSVGIGFAIPVNLVKRVVEDIVKTGRVRYGILGINLENALPGYLGVPEVRSQLKEITGAEPPQRGLLLNRGAVGSETAASEAGVKDFDVLLEIDGKKLDSWTDYLQALNNKRPGESVKLTYWSRGNTRTVTVKLRDANPSI